MSHHEKLLRKVLEGRSDANIPFDGLRSLLEWLGFSERVKGSHHIVTHPEIPEILNLQADGALAKPYQAKQIRQVIVDYRLGGADGA